MVLGAQLKGGKEFRGCEMNKIGLFSSRVSGCTSGGGNVTPTIDDKDVIGLVIDFINTPNVTSKSYKVNFRVQCARDLHFAIPLRLRGNLTANTARLQRPYWN